MGKEYTVEECPHRNSTDIIVASDLEHYAYPICCENRRVFHSVQLPDAIIRSGLFGGKMTALLAYLKNVCHASFSTIRKFFKDIFHITVSQGYLSMLITKVSQALQAPYEELFNVTIQFRVAHLIRDIKFLTTLKNKQTAEYGSNRLSGFVRCFIFIHNRELIDS